MSDKYILVQGLVEYVISKHKARHTWEDDFAINDMDLWHQCGLHKESRLFEIEPGILPEMIMMMEKDFESIATKVVHNIICSLYTFLVT